MLAMSWWSWSARPSSHSRGVWGATSWLLGEAATAKDVGAARVDVIKTRLAIGAGTTGIFALLPAVRRQRHNEVDATEKNVTELYTKAADQLGSDKAPVRLSGLYALERLAYGTGPVGELLGDARVAVDGAADTDLLVRGAEISEVLVTR
ncbi:hypothetical protein AB0M80_34635 [Amycolatopsis sp. NPDC051045]|uniref:hypothetical protein n=1 Tax=Amycolatopsis sp. NPDC051045 TaxID=3156922 RepID=UPI0034234663